VGGPTMSSFGHASAMAMISPGWKFILAILHTRIEALTGQATGLPHVRALAEDRARPCPTRRALLIGARCALAAAKHILPRVERDHNARSCVGCARAQDGRMPVHAALVVDSCVRGREESRARARFTASAKTWVTQKADHDHPRRVAAGDEERRVATPVQPAQRKQNSSNETSKSCTLFSARKTNNLIFTKYSTIADMCSNHNQNNRPKRPRQLGTRLVYKCVSSREWS
jgi:hypothetical protein